MRSLLTSTTNAGGIATVTFTVSATNGTVHTVTAAASDLERQRIRSQAAHALGTDPDAARIHVEVDTAVAGANNPFAISSTANSSRIATLLPAIAPK